MAAPSGDIAREILDRIADISVSIARLEERVLTKDVYHADTQKFATNETVAKLEKKINVLTAAGFVGTVSIVAVEKVPFVAKIFLSMFGG